MRFKLGEYFKIKMETLPFRLDRELILYFYALNRYPESFSISEASRDLGWPKSTVKRIIDRLVERELIRKLIVNNDVKYCVKKPIKLGLLKLSLIPYRKLPITLFLATFTTFILIGIILRKPPYSVLYPVTITTLGILMICLWFLTFILLRYEPL